jgi:hypothetical protein
LADAEQRDPQRTAKVFAAHAVKTAESLKHIRRREISAFSPSDEAGDPEDCGDVDDAESLMATMEAAMKFHRRL